MVLLALIDAVEGSVDEGAGEEPHDWDGGFERAWLLGLSGHLDDPGSTAGAGAGVEAGESRSALAREGSGYRETLEDGTSSHCD